jgi:hypothetical protein
VDHECTPRSGADLHSPRNRGRSRVAVSGQNILAGNFGVLLAALGSNTAYANVHTVQFPGGEIRGQVEVREEDPDEGKGQNR